MVEYALVAAGIAAAAAAAAAGLGPIVAAKFDSAAAGFEGTP